MSSEGVRRSNMKVDLEHHIGGALHSYLWHDQENVSACSRSLHANATSLQ